MALSADAACVLYRSAGNPTAPAASLPTRDPAPLFVPQAEIKRRRGEAKGDKKNSKANSKAVRMPGKDASSFD